MSAWNASPDRQEDLRYSEELTEEQDEQRTRSYACPHHPTVDLICPACAGAKGGAIGGRSRSPAKARAARRNRSKGGGWPKGKPRKPTPSPA